MVTSQGHTRWNGQFELVYDPLRLALAREHREDGWTIARIAVELGMSEATAWRAVRGIEAPPRTVKVRRTAHQWAPVAQAPHQTVNGAECWCLDPGHAAV